MTTRRGFLGAILAAAAAPAVVSSGILMPTRKIITPPDPVAQMRKLGETTIHGNFAGLKAGDVITIGGVVGATGVPRQFVVTGINGTSGIITALGG